MIIYDENNEPWFTNTGDPADEIAKGLGRRGFRRIVLPVQTIRTGQIPEPDIGALGALADALAVPYPATLDDVARVFTRRAVMEECCAVARNLVGSKKEEADGTQDGEDEGA